MSRCIRFWVSVSLLLLVCAARAAEDPAPEVDVRVSGIQDPLLTNVLRFLSIAQLEEEGFVSRVTRQGDQTEVSADEIQRRHWAAANQIREALMPYGYYRPQIEAELASTDEGYRASYHVDPGEPTRLRSVEVRVEGEGRDFPALEQALSQVALGQEDRLVHQRYDEAKDNLFNTAYDNGFLDAAWQASEIRVAPDRESAVIRLVLDTGPRFYFGATSIEQSVLNPNLMSGFVGIEEGEPYDVDRLLELQSILSETDYFSRVEVRAPRSAAGPDNRVPVRVVTEPSKPQKYSLGLGYGTDTGPRVKLSVLLRRINARGHRMQADIQFSAIEQAIGARYEIPVRNYATDTLSFSATARQEEIGDADTEQFSLGVGQLVNWYGFRRRLYLMAEREQFQFGDEPTRQSNLVYPGFTLSRERADNLQYPRRGYSVRADLRAGLESLLSEVSFSRLELSSRWVRGIGPGSRLLLRGEAGVLWTDDFGGLPPSQRFFAGGDRSIRGYDYRDVGPRNATDHVIGGERTIAGSIEFEHLFYGDYGAAAFVDAGDAFNGTPDIKVSAGIGFRWRSPIGMVRLDLAHPFDDPDNNYRIHLTIGADL